MIHMVDWSELPYDPIGKIENVDQVEDFVLFSCVCSSWRANAVKENRSLWRQLPWLKLHNNEHNVWGFYDFYKKKMFNFALPELRGRRCWGSSSGWICTAGSNFQISLLNPLTRAQIILPPTTLLDSLSSSGFCHRDHYVLEMNSFKDTDSDRGFLVVVVLVSTPQRLCFVRPGDKAWTTVADSKGPFFHFTVLRGQIFAADAFGNIYIFNSTDESPKLVLFAWNSGTSFGHCRTKELVTCFDRLFLITRYLERTNNKLGTGSFFVQEVDLKTKEWAVVEAFGDYAIFLGNNCSLAVLASEVAGFEPNNIYFLEVRYVNKAITLVRVDIGDFNMADKTFRSHYSGNNVQLRFCHPFWIMPSLY